MEPTDVYAEQSIIGAIIRKSDLLDKASERLNFSDFHDIRHQKIFRSITELADKDKQIDYLTVMQSCKDLFRSDEELTNYLLEIHRNSSGLINLDAYLDIVVNNSLRRKVASIGMQMTEAAYNSSLNIEDVLNDFEHKILAIEKKRNVERSRKTAKEIFLETINYWEQQAENKGELRGVSTGFNDLDQIIDGLHKGDMVVVAGRPSMGKTATSLAMSMNVAMKKKNVLIFSMEMPTLSIGERLTSAMSGVPSSKARKGQLVQSDYTKIAGVSLPISHAHLEVDDSSYTTLANIRKECRRDIKNRGSLDLVVVDHIGLIESPSYKSNENTTQKIAEFSRGLKLLARELDCCIIAISQLNRKVEERQDKRPVMSDLRDSGAIEQDADVVMLVYRDEYYNKERSQEKGIIELAIAKQRNGPLGTVKLKYDDETQSFRNM